MAAMLLVLMFGGTMLAPSLWAQEEENPTTGTIQGTILDDVGAPVEGAKVLYSSQATDTRGCPARRLYRPRRRP
jgi:hypothetical protein